MRIVADENMPLVAELFAPYGDVVLRPGRQLSPADIACADVLLVRSVTPVTAELVQNSRLKFVGSATIGTDHVDLQALQAQQITFANAPGCNAQAVAEYVIAALFVLQQRGRFNPEYQRIGIVGYGNVGRIVAILLSRLGWHYCVNDPPLARQSGDPGSGFIPPCNWVGKQDILDCDVISLHVPMSDSGPDSTWHWLNEKVLSVSRCSTIINSCRGAVVDNIALLQWLNQSPDHAAVIDVWEAEPLISQPLLRRADLASPHVAGYSLEGKIKGTRMIHTAFCRYFNFSPDAPTCDSALVEPDTLSTSTVRKRTDIAAIRHALWSCYDPRDDDLRMRHAVLDSVAPAQAFDLLRKSYPERHELGLRGFAPG